MQLKIGKNEIEFLKEYPRRKGPEAKEIAKKLEAIGFVCWEYWTSTVDVHVHPEFLPYMQDYTQPWTDKRFCEYFNITGYIDDDHAEPGSEWETILNTMKEYK